MPVDLSNTLSASREIGTAELSRDQFRKMVQLVRLLFRLSRLPDYRRLALASSPPDAGFDPGHDAVMMGFDFHLTPEGPKLIEVNTNAGGGLLALRAHQEAENIPLRRLGERLHRSFREEWERFSSAASPFPGTIVILDDDPQKQFLYPEMETFATLFRDWGATAFISEPKDLSSRPDGIFLQGEKIDFIYNRHCDFYLESAALEGIRRAYRTGTVCLSPNPFTYALLGDKRRFLLWSRPDIMASLGLSPRDLELLKGSIPESYLMVEMDPQKLWDERENWILKPITGFGSRGVVLGRSMSRARLASLDPQKFLVQKFIPPSRTGIVNDQQKLSMKTDIRLFAYRNQLLGIAARLYQGQVTNLRSPGAGFTPVKLI